MLVEYCTLELFPFTQLTYAEFPGWHVEIHSNNSNAALQSPLSPFAAKADELVIKSVSDEFEQQSWNHCGQYPGTTSR